MTKETKGTINRTAALLANSKAIKGLKVTLTTFLAFITLFGVIGFSLFILEESSQTIMFSMWQAIPAKRWDIAMDGVELMNNVNNTGKAINIAVGWINPLSFVSYKAFHKSTDHYIKALSARIFANEPTFFIGKKVSFTFTPKSVKHQADGTYLLTNGRIHVIVSNRPGSSSVKATGTLQQVGATLLVDTTK